MNIFKSLTIMFLVSIICSCGTNSGHKKSDFSINTNAKKNTISNSETLELSIENPKNHTIDSVKYAINNVSISEHTDLTNMKLGKHTVKATVFYNNEQQTATKNITILNSAAPKVYTYNIINEYSHDITSFTQGLEFYKGNLYESTGHYKESKLRQLDYKTGNVIKNLNLADEYFGEGLTVLNDKIYQLTWQKGTGFVYDVNTFKKINSFKYGTSKEGWGLCNDNTKLYKSDGTENIWILDSKNLIEEDNIQAYTNKGKIVGLNELEWINGHIYANRFQKNGVAIINPKNGAIIGVIDFSPLKNKVKQHETLDVLNGIAYNPETNTIFVTGKNWNKLFEVEVLEKQ